MPVADKFYNGQRFLKWRDKDSDPGVGPGYSCVLRIDPGEHILYWTPEFNVTKTGAIEYYYRYLSDIVDVRKGKHAVSYYSSPLNMSQKIMEKQALPFGQNNSLTQCLMTVVIATNFTKNEFLTFMTSSGEVDVANEWADHIFELCQKVRKRQRGVLYYMQRLLAPLHHANGRGIIKASDIVKAVVPSEVNLSDAARVSSSLKKTSLFSKRKWINCSELNNEGIFEIYMAITERTEIQQVFNRRTRDRKTRRPHGQMTPKKIERFLNYVQRDPRQNEVMYPMATRDTVKALLHAFQKRHDCLLFDGFAKYLLSDDNVEISNYSLRFVEDNMHEPLSCYFINSSHNSYLKGAQIWHARYFCADPSTSADVEIYRQILLSGCRCVELDCWDGSDGEPIVTHGPTEITFIEPVLFRDVCSAIAECAFKTSDYPICLSIENHCCSAQQAKMSEIFSTCFGNLLLREPLPGYPLEASVLLPSPYKLRRKILIKARKKERWTSDRSASLVTQTSKESNGSMSPEADLAGADEKYIFGLNTRNSDVLQRNSRAVYKMAKPEENSEKADELESETGINDEQKKQLAAAEVDKYSRELSSFVNYLEARPSFNLKFKRACNHYHRVHSMVEKKALDLVINFHSQLAKHNVRHITRVYPDGSRISSTNYMPLFGWMVGIQMMALNFQTIGLEMLMNSALFEENGHCGYVLKPQCLRDPAANINIFGDTFHNMVLANRIEINVLSGQLISTLFPNKAAPSTYVQIDFYGLPLEQLKDRFRTKTVYSNGINPPYGSVKDPPFVIEKVRFPERSLLHIRVMTDRNEQIAHRLLPVHLLTNGYRHIILLNSSNRIAGPASLFVRIKVSYFAQASHKALQEAFAEPLKNEIKLEEMKMNFADPLSCVMEGESIETDEVESEDEIQRPKKSSFVMESPTSSNPFSKFRKISSIFNRSG